jgi:hypothetical protein
MKMSSCYFHVLSITDVTLNQQNAQCSSLDVYETEISYVFSVHKGLLSGNMYQIIIYAMLYDTCSLTNSRWLKHVGMLSVDTKKNLRILFECYELDEILLA